MSSPIGILIVDDDEITCNLLEEVLSKEGYVVDKALNGREAIDKGENKPYDVVLTDIRMIDVDGMEVLRAYRQKSPDSIIIMMTAFGSIETAIRAIKEGAYDYVSKPFKLDEIKLTIRRALEQKRLLQENLFYRQELITKYKLENIVGRSPQMLQVYKTVARVAESRSTVLIAGESGTGKELVARAIHFNSPRSSKPYVAVDCGSLAETLLESELFGHVRGAFTGAVTNKKGLFEEADNGTCFLDEVGDISLAMQAKLLRVIQEHEIKRVGGTETTKIDVRIIAATNKNLEELVAEKKFREDLFYRLNVVSIHLPPLRERLDDIPFLADHFLRKYAAENEKPVSRISAEVLDLLLRYQWPGNVRELENVIERALTLSPHSLILPEDLPRRLRVEPSEISATSLPSQVSLTELEKIYIKKVLEETGGNKKRAADILGIDRRTLYRMAARYGISLKR
ncbi:MAG: sigma-54 dependent transcriptional regulator [Deltaproteobacteria bacterium]|jgi:DNA-binding NtrC family response regulator|nr:sigma-54 dependent transcriptional regulator [Deltaproteobacteria bacterium]